MGLDFNEVVVLAQSNRKLNQGQFLYNASEMIYTHPSHPPTHNYHFITFTFNTIVPFYIII